MFARIKATDTKAQGRLIAGALVLGLIAAIGGLWTTTREVPPKPPESCAQLDDARDAALLEAQEFQASVARLVRDDGWSDPRVRPILEMLYDYARDSWRDHEEQAVAITARRTALACPWAALEPALTPQEMQAPVEP